MRTSRLNLATGCAARVVLFTAAGAAGTTLFGLLCGFVHAALKWDARLVVAWVERFAVAGLLAGLIVGLCVAWDFASSFAERGFCGDKEWAADGKQTGDWSPLPATKPTRRHTPHEVNGRT
jgi:hypothetical protein